MEVSLLFIRSPYGLYLSLYLGATQGRPSHSFKGQAGHARQTKHMIRGLELLATPPDVQRVEELEKEVNNVANKTLDTQSSRSFLVGEHFV